MDQSMPTRTEEAVNPDVGPSATTDMPVQRAVPRRRAIWWYFGAGGAASGGTLLRRRLRPYEIPISYRPRSRAEGKKITAWDGVEALAILVRERVRRLPAGHDQASGDRRP
jgi:hypothetical protein